MNKKGLLATLLLAILGGSFLFSCTKKVESKPNYIFKAAPNESTALKVGSVEVPHSELYRGVESDIYEAEMKVWEIKMNRIQAVVLEKLMEADPNKKGLTNDQFLEKYITKGAQPTDKDVNTFIQERKIPAEHINDQMRERIKKFLEIELKKKYIEKWIGQKTAKNPVEVYVKKPVRPIFEVEVGDAPFMGGADAKVTIVEFSDFQCPFCKKGATIMDDLKKKYGNKIKIAFKQFPLPFHNHAHTASQAALCAYEQDKAKFWKFHDEMFGDQTKLDNEGLKKTAAKLGLKTDEFDKCLGSGKMAAKVNADMEQGKKVGVKSTPTFFVNGQMVNGAHPVETFSEIIDAELAK